MRSLIVNVNWLKHRGSEETLALVKEEIRQRQHVLDVLERDAAITKAQYERDTLFVKETLEARSARRKETIEVLKYVPAVIAAAGAIYAAYKKLKS